MEFADSTEHYAYLLERANGGTEHTFESVPQWPGLWDRGDNNIDEIFLDEGPLIQKQFYGQVILGQWEEQKLKCRAL